MEIVFKSIQTKDLKKKHIIQICKLKNIYWKFGIQNQLNWFKNNIRNNDIHNLCFQNNTLIGYTALRKGIYESNKIRNKFLLFETLIIDKSKQNLKFGTLMMNYNNFIINSYKQSSFLVCKKKLINFYKKFGWKNIDNRDYMTVYKSFNCSAMTYKLNRESKKKIYFNL